MAGWFGIGKVFIVIGLILIPWYSPMASLRGDAHPVSILSHDCTEGKILEVLCDPGGENPLSPAKVHGYTSLANPAAGQIIVGAGDDPLSIFSRRPLNHFIIPAGGLFMDTLHEGPHYGVDYANPDDYLNGKPTYFYPIGPGYVTARSTCLLCFADGDAQGRTQDKGAKYNFGWGSMVLVETPYSADVSIYVMYAHLNRDLVSLGDFVTPENAIGVAGTTGYSEEIHLHMEIRFGPPGQFWNADFSQQETLDRWLATMVAPPFLLVFPENHPSFVTLLGEWVALRHDGNTIP